VGIGELEGAAVGGGEQVGLASVSARPDRADSVDDVGGGEAAGGGSDGLAGGAAADPAARSHDVGATGAVDGPIHAASAPEGSIGSVHDGIDPLNGDVALDEHQSGPADL
jgi:hypothetical protein